MRITIVVKPNARKDAVEVLPNGTLRVFVKAPPRDGEANAAVIRLLAKHFGVVKTSVRVIQGSRGKNKLVEVLT